MCAVRSVLHNDARSFESRALPRYIRLAREFIDTDVDPMLYALGHEWRYNWYLRIYAGKSYAEAIAFRSMAHLPAAFDDGQGLNWDMIPPLQFKSLGRQVNK